MPSPDKNSFFLKDLLSHLENVPARVWWIGTIGIGVLVGNASGLVQFFWIFFSLFVYLLTRKHTLFDVLVVLYIALSQFEIGWGTPTYPFLFRLSNGELFRYETWVLITYADVVLLLLFVASYSEIKKQWKSQSVTDMLLISFFLWSLTSAASGFLPGRSYIGMLYLCRLVLIYIIFSRFPFTKKSIRLVVSAFSGVLMFQGSWAIYQFLRGGPTGRFFDLASFKSSLYANVIMENTYSLYRSSGTFADPNAFSLYILMLLPLALTQLHTPKALKIIPFISVLTATSAVLLSFSRTGWFLLIVTYGIYIFMYRFRIAMLLHHLMYKKMLLASVVVGGIILSYTRILPALISRISGIPQAMLPGGAWYARNQLLQEALSLIRSHPTMGVGLYNFIPAVVHMNITGILYYFPAEVHNIYLHIAGETGIIGSTLFILFIVSAIRSVLLHTKNNPVPSALFSGVFQFLVFGLFIPFTLHSAQTVLLFLLLSFGINQSWVLKHNT